MGRDEGPRGGDDKEGKGEGIKEGGTYNDNEVRYSSRNRGHWG